MTDQPKLTKRQIDGLKQIAKWRGYFWWKPVTMAELAALGYVEPIEGKRAFRLTESGRARARELTP